jgi:hypothetical protein
MEWSNLRMLNSHDRPVWKRFEYGYDILGATIELSAERSLFYRKNEGHKGS